MRPVFLNVGLADSETIPVRMTEQERLGLLLGLVQRADIDGACIVRIAKSATENTACISWTPGEQFQTAAAVELFIFRLAQTLGQEAIAAIIEGEGKLIGPMAEAWGEFDIGRFLPVFRGRDE